MRHQPARRSRPGFTMIELLVVMTIIAILMGLLLSGIVRVRNSMRRAEVVSEILKLDESLQAACQAYNQTDYLPSRLLLYRNVQMYKTPGTTYPQEAADAKLSAAVLTKMFGRNLLRNGGTVNWDGRAAGPRRILLTGQQCLVFYLGGIPSITSGNTCLGFSTDPLDPSNFTSGIPVKGPFYQFKSSRLVQPTVPARAPNSPRYSGRYFVYFDAFRPTGTPYTFFGINGADNGYNAADCPLPNPADATDTVAPYSENATAPFRFFNPRKWQIISAGRDLSFGGGGFMDPTDGVKTGAGADNLTNFARGELRSGASR